MSNSSAEAFLAKVIRTESGQMRDRLRAVELLAKMCGWNEPEKFEHGAPTMSLRNCSLSCGEVRLGSATTAICSKTSAASPHECLIEFLSLLPEQHDAAHEVSDEIVQRVNGI